MVFDAIKGGKSYLRECSLENSFDEFSTPSVEEVGYPSMGFSSATIAASDYNAKMEYSEGMKLQYLNSLQFGLSDKYYILDGKKYDLTSHPNLSDKTVCLYEIKDGMDILVNKGRLGIVQMEDPRSYWKEANISVYSPLYQGKKYKLVIPEGYLTIQQTSNGADAGSDFTKVNFIFNPELVFTFEGDMPATFNVKSCNVANNSQMNKLYNVVWGIEGYYELSESVSNVKFEQVIDSAISSTLKGEMPVSLYKLSGNTYVSVDFTNKTNGEPKRLTGKQSIDITLPAGLLVNTLNPDIVSDEVVLHINGFDNDIIAETVSVAVRVNGLHEAKHASAKGTPYSLALTPADNWVVESVTHDGSSLAENNGVYTTEPLTSNATIEVNLAYGGPWMIEHTTGVFGIEESNVRVFTESGMIVVEGVTSSDNIKVFNVAGMLIESVTPQKDRVNITVAPGQIYIVTVNDHAAKVQL